PQSCYAYPGKPGCANTTAEMMQLFSCIRLFGRPAGEADFVGVGRGVLHTPLRFPYEVVPTVQLTNPDLLGIMHQFLVIPQGSGDLFFDGINRSPDPFATITKEI